MAAISASALAEALADERMLEPEQYDQFIRTMLPICQDVPILAKELVYRGWLTPFQVEQILAGFGHTLILGSYVLLEPLGEGGMGRVFRARNWKLNRHVAIKVIREEQARQPAVVARFQREIRALGRIHHPNIVMAIDADFQRGSIWYAMEYIRGMDLGRHVRTHGPVAIQDACDFAVQIADALQHAHDCGLVHRDIKPSNLILCDADRSIKLLDLGLTRCELPVDDSAFAELTRAGAIIGTPDYMAPEQIQDSRGADIRSDLYSLGCTFYFLVTGRAPFEDTRALVDKLFMQCESEPVEVERLRPDVPSGLARIVRRLMAKRRRDRFQSPAELIAALLDLHDGAVLPARDTTIASPQAAHVSESPFPPRMQPTELISHVDVELVRDPETIDDQFEYAQSKPANWMTPARFAIAILLATLAMMLFWQAGKGPGSLRGNPAPSDPEKTLPRIQDDAPPNHNDVSGKGQPSS
jgi:serine/threonine-protein kinase